jgi:hypothetical protein
MKHKRLLAPLVVGLALVAAGCGGGGGSSAEESDDGPAKIYEMKGSDLSRVELTAEAAKRLDVQTAAVQQNGSGKVVPYSAVLYSPTGETWVYVSPKPLTFVRHEIVVDRIDGDRALLKDGPSAGTKVATVGVAELFGAESGLGE